MEELKERIKTSDLKDNDVVNALFKDINALDNDEKKEELFSSLFGRVHETFLDECMENLPEMDVIFNSISDLRAFFVNASGLSSNKIDEYFSKYEITFEKIVAKMMEKVDIEISEINEELKDDVDLSADVNMTIENLEKEIETLEKEKSEERKKYNAEIEAIKKELERRELDGEFTVDEIKQQIEELERQIVEYKNILNDENNFKKSLEGAFDYGDLENQMNDLEIDLENLRKLKNVKDIEKQIAELKSGLGQNAEQFIGLSAEEIEKKIEELERQIAGYKNILNDENGFKKSLEGAFNYGDLENQINDLEIDLECLKKLKNINDLEKKLTELKSSSVRLDDEDIRRQISELEERLRMIDDRLGLDDNLEEAMDQGQEVDYDQLRIELITKIKELKEELEKRKNNRSNDFSNMTKEELMKKLEELVGKSRNSQSEFDKKISELQNKLKKLKRLEKLKEFKKSGKGKEPLPPEKEIPVEKKKDEKMWKKCLHFVAGFGVGLGLSAVPGVGTIRMVAAGVKLTISGINAWTKKFPEGKVAKIVSSVDKKINNSKIVNSFKEKHPGIVSGVGKVKNKIKAILANKYVNCFINGVSAGYITGNIIELVTGQSISELLQKPDSSSQTLVYGDVEPQEIVPDNDVINPEPIPVPPVPDVSLNPGEVFDISGISEGFVSSTAKDSVNLITNAGKEAVVDKFVTLPNGEVMVHFKQINGKGYAWFKESVVKEHLTKIAEAAAKSGRSI